MISFLISVAPQITEHPQDLTQTEGENLTLSCNASGNPVPSFSWTIDGSRVNTTVNPRISFSLEDKQLTITNVKRTDSTREYRCVANNIIATATSNAATLNIQCKYSLVFNVSLMFMPMVARCSILSRGLLPFLSIGTTLKVEAGTLNYRRFHLSVDT